MTTSGSWCHILCAQYIPEIADSSPFDLSQLAENRISLVVGPRCPLTRRRATFATSREVLASSALKRPVLQPFTSLAPRQGASSLGRHFVSLVGSGVDGAASKKGERAERLAVECESHYKRAKVRTKEGSED